MTCPCEALGLFACPRGTCAGGGAGVIDPSPWVPRTEEDARKVAWYVTARTGVAVLSVKVMSPFDSSGPRIYLQTPIAESLPRAYSQAYKRYTVDAVAGAQFVTVPSDWRMGDLPISHTCMYCGEEFTNERDRDGHEDTCLA